MSVPGWMVGHINQFNYFCFFLVRILSLPIKFSKDGDHDCRWKWWTLVTEMIMRRCNNGDVTEMTMRRWTMVLVLVTMAIMEDGFDMLLPWPLYCESKCVWFFFSQYSNSAASIASRSDHCKCVRKSSRIDSIPLACFHGFSTATPNVFEFFFFFPTTSASMASESNVCQNACENLAESIQYLLLASMASPPQSQMCLKFCSFFPQLLLPWLLKAMSAKCVRKSSL